MFKKILCLMIFAAVLVAFSGCAPEKKTDRIFVYDLTSPADTLDPQFATSQSSLIIAGNVYEGLFVERENGVTEPGAAQSYTVSPNGLEYTFTLREGLKWSNGQALTADDFLFAFERLFDPKVPSAYATELLAIKNSAAVLAGELPVSALGVRAPAGDRLVITLEHREDNLPLLLAKPYAAPCNRVFFAEQMGRYGVGLKTSIFNGPFVVKSWDNTKSIYIVKNEHYVSDSPTLAAGVRFYIGRENPAKIFADGGSDACFFLFEEDSEFEGNGETAARFENTVWALVFNPADEELQNADLRAALALDPNFSRIGEVVGDRANLAHGLVPEVSRVGNSGYRELVGGIAADYGIPNTPKERFAAALEQLEIEKISPTDLLVTDGELERAVAGVLQSSWSAQLAAHINVVPLSREELDSRVASGNYRMAIVPFTPADLSPESLLLGFVNTYNLMWQPEVAQVISEELAAAKAAGGEHTAALAYRRAEQAVLDAGAVVPIYATSCRYLVAPGTQGIEFSPYYAKIYFKYARES